MDILHNEVDVLRIIVSLMIFYNVGMVKLVENCNLLHDAINIIFKLLFVKHLNCDKMVWIVVIVSLEHSSKGTDSKHLGL